jgi:hypothetical protein
MTLAITANIVLSAIVFTVIVGAITRSIMTSRQAPLRVPARANGARERVARGARFGLTSRA